MRYLEFQSAAFTVRESTFRKREGQLWEVGCLFKYRALEVQPITRTGSYFGFSV